jgi:hypothetical protein
MKPPVVLFRFGIAHRLMIAGALLAVAWIAIVLVVN